MRNLSLRLFVLAVSLAITPSVWAEGNDRNDGKEYGKHEDEYTALGKRAMDILPNRVYEDNKNDANRFNVTRFQFGNDSQSTMPYMYDILGSSITGEDGKGNKKEIPADSVKHSTFMLPAFGGIAALMQGDAIRKGMEAALKGETAQYSIAYAQVEPGIAQGFDAAFTAVNTALSNTYNAYNTFINQPFENEDVKKKFLIILNECIYKKMQKDQASWVQAVSQCLGDNGIEDDKYKVNAKDTKSEAADKLKDEDHPAHSKNHKNAVVENKISVAAELFNYGDIKHRGEQDQRRKLYESWLKMFGDYEFKIDDSQNNNMYKLMEKRIPPEKRLSEIQQILLQDRFSDYMHLAAEYCEYMSKMKGESYGNEQSFWAKNNLSESAKKFIFRLSTPERVIDAAAVEIPVRLVLVNQRGSEEEKYKATMNFFDNNSDLEKIIQSGGQVGGSGKTAILFVQGYSNFVAMSQLIRSVQEAVYFVGSRTAGTGGVSATISDRALKLINDVVKVDRLDQALITNSTAWDEFIREGFHTAQLKSNQGGLRAQVRNGNSSQK